MNERGTNHRDAQPARTLRASLPARDQRLARLHRCIAGLRAQHPRWRRLVVPLPTAVSAGGAAEKQGRHADIAVDCRHGRLGLRVGAAFPALLACSRIADAATRDAVATLLMAEALPDWLARAAEAEPSWQASVAPVAAEAPAPRVPFGIRLGDEPGEYAPLLDVSPVLLEALESFARAHRTGVPERLSALAVPGRIVLDRRTIPIDALRRLRCGDIVLTRFGAARTIGDAMAGNRFSLIWGHPALAHPRASVQLEDAGVTLLTHPELVDDTLDALESVADRDIADPVDEAAAADGEGAQDGVANDTARIDLSDMQIPLLIAIDAPAMTLAELAALEPGVALELPERPENARVRLSAHGQMFASGRLVVVGERLGVEITRIERKFAGADE